MNQVEDFSPNLKDCVLNTLKGQNWLNDKVHVHVYTLYNNIIFYPESYGTCIYFYQIINFYFKLIEFHCNVNGQHKVHTFNSYFYSNLCEKGYSGVRRWTKKVRKTMYKVACIY